MNPSKPRGYKYVSGQAEWGQLVLTRQDDSTSSVPLQVAALSCILTDNGDGTCTLTV